MLVRNFWFFLLFEDNNCCENRRTTRARARVSSVYSTCDAGYDVGKADEREGFDVGKADAPACTSSTQFQVGKNVRKNS